MRRLIINKEKENNNFYSVLHKRTVLWYVSISRDSLPLTFCVIVSFFGFVYMDFDFPLLLQLPKDDAMKSEVERLQLAIQYVSSLWTKRASCMKFRFVHCFISFCLVGG